MLYTFDFYYLENYSKEDFCIDFAIDYCNSDLTPSLKAIINDYDLVGHDMTSVFGSKCTSGPNMILFKQIGYSVTIFFLLLTIIIHLGIIDIRKVCK